MILPQQIYPGLCVRVTHMDRYGRIHWYDNEIQRAGVVFEPPLGGYAFEWTYAQLEEEIWQKQII